MGAFITRRLFELAEGQPTSEKPLKVMTSTATKSVQTALATVQASQSSLSFRQNSGLNAIDRGRLDGPWWEDESSDKPPFEELGRRDPAFYAKWNANKLRTRFPGGESYYDVMTRTESVLLEIEMSTTPVLCVSHITPISVLLSYFTGTRVEDAWDVSVPEHKLFEIRPTLGGGYTMEVVDVGDEPVRMTSSRSLGSRLSMNGRSASSKNIPALAAAARDADSFS